MNSLDNVKYFWKDLPTWAKGVTLIAAIGIPSYIGYTIYKNKQNEKERLKRLEDMKSVDDTIKNLQNSGQKQSYPDSQYLIFADVLYGSMDGCGTEVNKIYDVFDKMNNDIDVNKLISAYGVDKKISCWASGSHIGGLASSLTKELGLNLFDGIYKTRFGYDCTKGNGLSQMKVLNCILNSKGIKTQF